MIIIDRFCIALFSALEQTHCAHVACDFQGVIVYILYRVFLISTEVVYWQRSLVVAWLVLRETAAVSAQVLCTPFTHAPVYSYFNQIHTGRVHVCLAVTCHLHFWQNDRDLPRAAAVTREWNGYSNKSQHRKLTLEKKILPREKKAKDNSSKLDSVFSH